MTRYAAVGIRRADSCKKIVSLFLSPKTASAVCEYGDVAVFDDSASFFPAHSLEHKKSRRHSWVYVRQYCDKIDEEARHRMKLIVRSLAEQNDMTEQLKAENQMEWVRQMNACKAQAEEIVKAELIYD